MLSTLGTLQPIPDAFDRAAPVALYGLGVAGFNLLVVGLAFVSPLFLRQALPSLAFALAGAVLGYLAAGGMTAPFNAYRACAYLAAALAWFGLARAIVIYVVRPIAARAG